MKGFFSHSSIAIEILPEPHPRRAHKGSFSACPLLKLNTFPRTPYEKMLD